MCEGCKETIQIVDDPWHVVQMVLNILSPGLGTIINGCQCCCECCGVRECRWSAFFIGLLQDISSLIIIGWIWSIFWGVLIYQKTANHIREGQMGQTAYAYN